jgi:alpha-D-ribose 1-methylphosphonate 5-phosphate C-P lyase
MTILFQMANLRTMKQLTFSLLSLIDLFDLHGLLNAVSIARNLDIVFDVYAMNVRDSAAVVDVFYRTQFLKQIVHHLLVFNKRIPDVAELLLSGSTVDRICHAAVELGCRVTLVNTELGSCLRTASQL